MIFLDTVVKPRYDILII
ncbi:hypothetical protein RRIM16_05015 [Rickettsia conorii subsp. raoultii]|nr:hypothetical protein RRIM16_05015 [Rickettsia conorii subsp. raoultii]